MPRPVYPDWRVVLTKPDVLKAVRSSRGFGKLATADRAVAEKLNRYIRFDAKGNRLTREERLRRMDELTFRQHAASRRIAAHFLWEHLKTLEYMTLNGHRVTTMVAFGPRHLHERIKDLQIAFPGYRFTDDIRKNRPDIAIRTLRRWIKEAEAVAENPECFAHARETFAEDARKFRRELETLDPHGTYGGSGRRPSFDPELAGLLIDAITDWITSAPDFKDASSRSKQIAACDALIGHVCVVAKQLGCPIHEPSQHDVFEIFFEARRPRLQTGARRVVGLALGTQPDTIRKAARTRVEKRR